MPHSTPGSTALPADCSFFVQPNAAGALTGSGHRGAVHLLQCRHCPKKHRRTQNPESANHCKGAVRQVSFTLESSRASTCTAWMKHRVESHSGKEICSHQMSVVKPVFGIIGSNKGLNRFSLGGWKKVRGQWQLHCLAHNSERLANYGQLAA